MRHWLRATFENTRVVAFALVLWSIPLAYAAEPPAEARDEIKHLLAHLEASGCQFFRNGEWYGATEAKDHLNQKYNYLLKKGLIRKAEDFIRLAATESSVSGKAYQVRCQGADAIPSATWLNGELLRYREQVRSRK